MSIRRGASQTHNRGSTFYPAGRPDLRDDQICPAGLKDFGLWNLDKATLGIPRARRFPSFHSVRFAPADGGYVDTVFPRSVRVECTANHCGHFPHAISGERAVVLLFEPHFLERGNEVTLQERGRGQSRLPGLEFKDSWPLDAPTPERHHQD